MTGNEIKNTNQLCTNFWVDVFGVDINLKINKKRRRETKKNMYRRVKTRQREREIKLNVTVLGKGTPKWSIWKRKSNKFELYSCLYSLHANTPTLIHWKMKKCNRCNKMWCMYKFINKKLKGKKIDCFGVFYKQMMKKWWYITALFELSVKKIQQTI